MLAVSSAAITKYKKMVDRVANRAKNVLQEQKDRANTVINTAEVSAASFLFGLAQGKFGGIEFVGVPVDLIAGVALHVMGFADVAGKKNSRHFHAIGDGALASFFNGVGRNLGYSVQTDDDRRRIAEAAAKRKKQYSTLPSGAYSFGMSGEESGGASLADEELARMVAAGRQ